jgi:hypothetical protein
MATVWNGLQFILTTSEEDYTVYTVTDTNESKSKVYKDLIPKRIIFNGRATIAFWPDDTKTVVRCAKDEKFIPEVGVAEAIVKRVFGGTAKGRERFLRLLKKAQYQDEKKKKYKYDSNF